MSKKYWVRTAEFDGREFSLWERLLGMILPYYYDHEKGLIRIRPYALYLKFDKDGKCQENPFLHFSFFGGIRWLIHEENRYRDLVRSVDPDMEIRVEKWIEKLVRQHELLDE